MRNERLVISRERLLEEVWGYDPMAMTNTIDVFISNLRRKLEAEGEPRILHTKRGAGYVIRAAAEAMMRRLERLAPRRWHPKRWPLRWRLAAVSAGPDLPHPRRLRARRRAPHLEPAPQRLQRRA